MARVAGVNIPKNKRFEIALTYIYGIGSSRAKYICKTLGISPSVRTEDIQESVLDNVRALLAKEYPILEGELRRKVTSDIKRLVNLGCYRGIRHTKRLPVRGQRTHTNARSRKGKAVAVAGKKKATK